MNAGVSNIFNAYCIYSEVQIMTWESFLSISANIAEVIMAGVALFSFFKNIKLTKQNIALTEQSINLTSRYNEMVNTQTLTAQGALETQIRNAINESNHEIIMVALEKQKYQDVEKRDKTLMSALELSEENYRNAYEDACAKYLDSKVDRDRFEKMYKSDIRKLVESDAHKKYYADIQSPYSNTRRVYEEWFKRT